MNDVRWRRATLRDIPSSAQLPGYDRDEYLKGMNERAPHILERWRDAEARFASDSTKWHALRPFLGIESFGANAVEARDGELLVVPHDELGEGEQNEELYLVVEGKARFVCDGEAVELAPGEVLYARPGVLREAVAAETPTMLLIVGGRPEQAYSPPIWATDWHGTE